MASEESTVTDRIADYAMIGDLRTGALVGRTGSIDWGCFPTFSGDAAFAALLGDASNGTWTLHPKATDVRATRSYRNSTLILETEYETDHASASVTDFMPLDQPTPTIVRIVRGSRGSMPFATRFAPRFKYGRFAPFGACVKDGWTALGAPHALCLRSSMRLDGSSAEAGGEFSVGAGDVVTFVMQYFSAALPAPEAIDAAAALRATESWWTDWAAAFTYEGPYREAVVRSAVTLKSLSSVENGSFVAAITTSLPERIGDTKNWDYRYTWIRDASFSVSSLLRVGFRDEARGWFDWFRRVCSDRPDALHIMYGADGDYLEAESEISWLAGFAGSSPVRIFNAAHTQFQLGIYGDVLMSFEDAQRAGMALEPSDWERIESIVGWLASNWKRSGNGIWERRGGGSQYVDSKLMAWVAFDRAIAIARRGGFATDFERWQRTADAIKNEICRAGYDPVRETFTQYYGSTELDASVLMIPLVGMLPASDPRVVGTVAALERELVDGGFVYRYSADDGGERDRAPTEGAFAMCAFWLVRVYAMLGRHDDAIRLFERVAGTASDVGLMSEEFDLTRGIAIGNFPQAFSHAGLIDAAVALARAAVAVA